MAIALQRERPLVSTRYTLFFPEGLVGCPDWRHFVLQDLPSLPPDPVGDEAGPADPHEGLLYMLRCLDDQAISFLVAEASRVYPEYVVELSPADIHALELEKVDQPLVLCTLTVRQRPLRVTANLLGPLVINPRTGLGRQVVLADTSYPVCYRLV